MNGFACSESSGGGTAQPPTAKTGTPAPKAAAPASNEPEIASYMPAPAVDLPPGSDSTRTVVFAGGCFWCVEAVYEQIDGVKDVVSGYAGGKAENAKYMAVVRGGTNHAEVVRVTYDPARITYGTLLRVFFATHDPTTLNRQGPDSGAQYRSSIFYQSEEEKQVASKYIEQLTRAKAFDSPIVTKLEPLEAFYVAEGYHQDYARQNPNDAYIYYNAKPKVEKVKKDFKGLLRKDDGSTSEPATGS
ncbi:MAG: peptide-methionine (S)-S-oxide reductase MsrA [Phycisphaerae bacterium]|nr:peptide-methionine (S)-S-oxide reductase MsrA [Phycisphaerae bacterium]